MKRRDIHIGLRVEITAHPFKGRTGTVRAEAMLWEIWCDNADFLGRQLVRVHSGGIRPLEVTI